MSYMSEKHPHWDAPPGFIKLQYWGGCFDCDEFPPQSSMFAREAISAIGFDEYTSPRHEKVSHLDVRDCTNGCSRYFIRPEERLRLLRWLATRHSFGVRPRGARKDP